MLARIHVYNELEVFKQSINQQLAEIELKNPHPDLIYFEAGEKLGVAESKQIRAHLNLKPVKAKTKAVVVESAEDLTPEAQNALLKVLEEPSQEALIILGVSSLEKLLPTVVSRCIVTRLVLDYTSDVQSYAEEIEELMESSLEKRFVFVEKLEDKEGFLRALTIYFQQPESLASHTEGVNDNSGFLEELLQAQIWANQNVNIRAILEYLMLQLPSKM